LDLVESDADASATVRVSVAVQQARLPALPDAVVVSSAGSAVSHTYCEYDNVNDE